jgi:hypothetical protein
LSRPYFIENLKNIRNSDDLIRRLNAGEDSAYSEALIATYFLQTGFEVRLQPVLQTGRRNDVSVRVGSQWVNIEIKTPQRSELQEEMATILDELLNFVHRLPVSRDVYIFLTREPSIEEQKQISDKTLELALTETQPVDSRVDDIAFIRTENLGFKTTFTTPTRMIGRLNMTLPFPTSVIDRYKIIPFMFVSSVKFDTSENGININFTIYAPFEDSRIIAMINKKRKQLSPNSMNMIAFDTTHIPITPNLHRRYRWESRLIEAMNERISRRVGAVAS